MAVAICVSTDAIAVNTNSHNVGGEVVREINSADIETRALGERSEDIRGSIQKDIAVVKELDRGVGKVDGGISSEGGKVKMRSRRARGAWGGRGGGKSLEGVPIERRLGVTESRT